MKTTLPFILVLAIPLFYACKKETKSIKATAANPTACFTVSKDTIFAGDTISFSDCSTGADTVLYDFSDGHTSTSRNSSHLFVYSGIYEISQKASANSISSTSQRVVVVKPTITSALSWRYFRPNSAFDSVIFTRTGDGLFQFIGWDYGLSNIHVSGFFSKLDSFSYSYSDNAIYIHGTGYFSHQDSLVYMVEVRFIDNGSGIFSVKDTFFGIRR